jgi:2-polyprenyl-3-methyl-5-hydroxy-6-metoxy-1,4-benzoquinol methylase
MAENTTPDPKSSSPSSSQSQLENLEYCPLCESAAIVNAPQQPNPPFGLKQCSTCNAVFLSPRPRIEAMSAYYDAYYDKEDSDKINVRQVRRAQRHFRRLSRHSKPGRLLEIGAGDGYFLKEARDAGWKVEGLELSHPRVERAKKWFDLELLPTDISSVTLEIGGYDAVAFFQLIEHVHDPRALIRRSYELLKPGGVLMMSTPNVLAYGRKLRDVNSWRIPRHLFFFTPRTLVRSAERAGFDVLKRTLKFHATLEERLGWQPWPKVSLLGRVTRDLWTPFGLHVVARKR